jgi:hypothetical protein
VASGFERRCCKAGGDDRFVVAKMKGADWGGLTDVKAQAAHRWSAAVNATGEFGQWDYRLAFSVREFATQLDVLAGQCMAVSP